MKKIFTASNIVACLTFLFALAFIILYNVNISSAGYFQGITAPNFLLFAVFALVLEALVILLSFLDNSGVIGRILDVFVGACKVLAPMLLLLAVMALLQARIEGLGYIYFSNVDVAKEVATPVNLASAGCAIAAMVIGAVAAIVGIVGAFFMPKQSEQAAVEVKEADKTNA